MNADHRASTTDYTHQFGAASHGRSTGAVQRLQRFLHAYPSTVPVVILLLAIAIFSVVSRNFLTALNITLILQQVSIVGVLALAQTLVILTAGIDLSVGAVMVLSYMLMARLAVNFDINQYLAILIGMAAATACGVFNGWVVTRFRLTPFIVTLGTWKVFFALNLFFSSSQTVRSADIDKFAPVLKFFGQSISVIDTRITYGSILMIVLFVVFWYLLRHTAWGREVYAVGDDPQAAEQAGIRTNRVLISVYATAGLICGIAAWSSIGRVGAAGPHGFQEANLESITAVVIGGTSLFGGRGAVLGTLFGALIVGVFSSGLKLAGVDVLWQLLALGLLVIVAAVLDQWIRRISV